MKSRVKINPALAKKVKGLEDTLENRVKAQLAEMAEFAVGRSPVDTGAYVTSFSIKDSYSSGRGRTSKNKPRRQNTAQKRQEGLSQMLQDIERLKPLEKPRVILSNGSPHADKVEKLHGYAVFAQVKDKFR